MPESNKDTPLGALKAMPAADRRRSILDFILNNAMFIIIAVAIIFIAIKVPSFL